MFLWTKPGRDVFSPWNADGTSRKIVPQDAQILTTEYERILESFAASGGAVIFSTKAEADGNLAYAAKTMAWVIDDSTPAYNGIYQK